MVAERSRVSTTPVALPLPSAGRAAAAVCGGASCSSPSPCVLFRGRLCFAAEADSGGCHRLHVLARAAHALVVRVCYDLSLLPSAHHAARKFGRPPSTSKHLLDGACTKRKLLVSPGGAPGGCFFPATRCCRAAFCCPHSLPLFSVFCSRDGGCFPHSHQVPRQATPHVHIRLEPNSGPHTQAASRRAISRLYRRQFGQALFGPTATDVRQLGSSCLASICSSSSSRLCDGRHSRQSSRLLRRLQRWRRHQPSPLLHGSQLQRQPGTCSANPIPSA